jgi:hypothetical protein
MKKIILLVLLISTISFGQKPKHKNKHKHQNKHHNHHVQKPNYNFWFGIALLDAISGNNNNYYHSYGWSDNTVMEMHFRYIPRRDEWVLQSKRKNVSASYFLDYGKPRIVATFDHPNYNMHDYSVIVHRDGYWEYDCPNTLTRYFTRKIKNNINSYRRW